MCDLEFWEVFKQKIQKPNSSNVQLPVSAFLVCRAHGASSNPMLGVPFSLIGLTRVIMQYGSLAIHSYRIDTSTTALYDLPPTITSPKLICVVPRSITLGCVICCPTDLARNVL